jgi:cytochrome d ubiquinol oxidase subunit II
MEILWYCLLAFMLTGYVILDGFDLGAGIIHLLAATDDRERRQVLASIGPVWDGNEVWLLAAGGTLFFAFPTLYAAAFSGFYLPLMIVLWLLIFRGLGIEFRSHIRSPIWTAVWDVAFSLASLLLAVFFGAALGNVIRGVPLEANREFFLPLWTNFSPHGNVGILDWFTIATGLLALTALTMHGGLWVVLKTDGDLARRAGLISRRAAWSTLALTALVTLLAFSLQPQIARNFTERPWGAIFPIAAMAGLAGALTGRFLASCLYLAGMMASAAFGIYPYVLPALHPDRNLTIYNSATGAYGMGIGLWWWIPGMVLATAYSVFLFRRFRGKVRVE